MSEISKEDCKHESVIPEFDLAEAKKMSAREIRLRYPRFCGVCPDCGYEGIIYASFEQYIYGDY